jgi:hypothetical protein
MRVNRSANGIRPDLGGVPGNHELGEGHGFPDRPADEVDEALSYSPALLRGNATAPQALLRHVHGR